MAKCFPTSKQVGKQMENKIREMIKTIIIYDHKNRGSEKDERPLEVRITIDRKSYYINTGIKVRRSEWKSGVIVNRPNSDQLNTRLNIIYKNIENEVNDAIEEGRALDVADIRRRAWIAQVDESSTSLLDWLNEQVGMLTFASGTLQHYRTMLVRLHEFDGIRRWKDLTIENIYKWDAWLHKLPDQKGDGTISDGAIYNYHKCLKALLNRAVLFDRLKQNPYDRLRGKFKRGDKERIDFLTEEEMAAFVSLHPMSGSKMERVRDLFVFQLYTGLSYADTQIFDIADYKQIDGVWKNTGERIKTGVAYTSQLLPPVVEILQRYDMKVPKIDNSEYNLLLKGLGMACGIERPLHSHMARHTFATYMLRHGVPIEHVSKMLGHTNIKQTQRYAKIVAADIHDDFSRIATELTEKDKGR